MKTPILKFPDPNLRKKAEPVRQVNQKIKSLIDTMFLTMAENNGVGLAATQIGRTERVFVVAHAAFKQALVNPRIIRRSGKKTDLEGCLSLPGIFLPVERSYKVTVEGLTRQGKKIIIEEEDLLARAFQQEIDHLDGRLIIDLVPREVLAIILTELEKNPPPEQTMVNQALINAIRKEQNI